MIDKVNNYKPDIAIPPGDTLSEILRSLHMSQLELSTRTGMSKKTINQIIKGIAPILPSTAFKFEKVLNIPASFWINIENNYQEIKAKIEAERNTKKEEAIAKEIPYDDMVKLKWIPEAKTIREKVINFRDYFNIASLDLIPQVHSAIFRISNKQPYSKYAISAWIEKGRKEAIGKDLASFEKDKIKNCLNILKQLTLLGQNDFLAELDALCSKCGIALVVLPYLSKTRINGVVYWLDSKTVIIQLSNRYKYTDIFWFSFFHELSHALLHGKKEIFLEDDEQKNRFELEADYFAANTLISKTSYNKFIKSISLITEKSILELANKNSISPGIVVGRLEHDNIVSRGKFAYLKTKLDLN